MKHLLGAVAASVWAAAALSAGTSASNLPEVEPEPETPTWRETLEVPESVDDDAVESARRVSVTAQELAMVPVTTVSEATGLFPGLVTLFSAPYGGTPMSVVRGFFGGGEVEYLSLEVDGTPAADLESGVADWHGIRLADVERLDYVPGPSLRRGGVDPALAGALRIVTRRATEAGGGMSLSGGEFATRGAEASWGDPVRSLELAADGAASHGYRDNGWFQEAGARARWTPSSDSFAARLSGSFRHRDREEPGPLALTELAADRFSSNPLFDDDREHVERWNLGGQWTSGDGPVELRATAAGRRSDFLRTLLVAEGYGDRALRHLETESVSLAVSTPGEMGWGEHFAWRASLDGRHETAVTRYEASFPAADRARRQRVVAEIGGALRPDERWEIDLSLRGDRVSDRSRLSGATDREAWSPRLGLVYALAEKAQLFAEYGRSFKAPSLDQLYDPRPFVGPGGPLVLSNAALEPQRMRGGEVGARGGDARLTWHALAYRYQVEDEIDFDPLAFRYANIGRSRHEGLEAMGRWTTGRAGTLRLTGARSVARAEGASPTRQLKNVPRTTLDAGWTIQLPGAIDADISHRLWRGRWADDFGGFPLGDVRRTDLRLARAWSGNAGAWRLRLDVLNLFDRQAVELGYLLPAADGEGVALHAFPSLPRTWRAGLELRW